MLSKGIEPTLETFKTMATVSRIFILVFIIWLIWIQADGIVAAHNVKKSRGILISIISFIAAVILVTALSTIGRALL